MITFKYKLEDSDYIEYLAGQATENKTVRISSLVFTYCSIPVAAAALWLTGIRNPYMYMGLLLLLIVWIPFSKKIVGRIIEGTVKKNLAGTGTRKYPEMKVSLDGRNISVMQNGKRTNSEIIGYKTYGTIMAAIMKNGNTMIIPTRIFNENLKLADLLREIQQEG